METTEQKTILKLAVTLLLCLPGLVGAFDITGRKWIGGATDFHVSLNGNSATGLTWNGAFLGAIDDWNQSTTFNFSVIPEYRDPCADDSVNSVDFTQDVCGSEYGENTLAVTLLTYVDQVLGPARLLETDIVVNQAVDYDIFDGNLVQFGLTFNGLDFRRVALHELGHAMGLGHEPENSAIMSPSIGNLDRVTEDDITGINTLYGGLQSCMVRSLSFGLSNGSLSEGDCTVQQLTVGGGDTSFIDLYRFDLAATTTVQFSMSGANLDSVLVLADSDLRYLDFDNKSGGECDSSLTRQLAPGSYLLLANTFDVPVKAECGNTGAYRIDANFVGTEQVGLGVSNSLLGGNSAASFSGGISADGGQTWGNLFKPSDSLDISARIDVDPAHVGQSGFLVVAAVLGGQVLLMNEAGVFEAADLESGPIARAANKDLSAVEDIQIATALVPAALGVDNIVVDFTVGYGLTAAPAEIYYHPLPINLTVSP